MNKIDIITSAENLEQVKGLCNKIKTDDIVFSEVKIFSPELTTIKRYRGAEYQLELISKIKAELLVSEQDTDQALENIESILDKAKGDKFIVYKIDRQS